MTPHHESTGIAALDELGLRLEAAAARPPARRLTRPRRWAALALGALAITATPALAATVFNGPPPLEETPPQVGAAIDRSDPVATGRALAREGFRVHWILVTDNPERGAIPPTRSRDVAAPPAGTEILSVLNAKGGNEADTNTRDLMVEIAPLGSAILEEHR